ncbi:MAG: carbohydrate-binding cenc domain protein [Paenibacillaceae bacterium]|jgi:hypothetical protein|nr:carbohydrate-binding cenc domain protein [Paenibacillaceae bacterium]
MLKRIMAIALIVSLVVPGMSAYLAVVARAAGNMYYVSDSGGNDASGDGSMSNPWKTISKAAHTLNAGDTVIISGGTYREYVANFKSSGTSEAPITYMAAPGEMVTISGTEPVAGFVREGTSNIYKGPVTMNLGSENQVFRNGNAMNEARWPDMEPGATLSMPTLATMQGGSLTTARDTNLPDIDYTGAKIWSAGGYAWVGWIGTISSFNPASKTLTFNNGRTANINYDATGGNRYYVFGNKALLDTDGEWWYDGSGNLYVYSSVGAPTNIEVKTRITGIEIAAQSYINITGIHLIGCNIVTGSGSSHITIDGITARNVSSGPGANFTVGNTSPRHGITINGTDNTIKNSDLAYATGDILIIYGSRNKLINSTISDGNYIGSYNASVLIAGIDAVISNNTITRSGRTGLSGNPSMRRAIIQYNDISQAGLLTADTAGIYIPNVDAMGTEIRYNKIHDIDTHLGAGIYLDNATSNFLVHHNVIWNTKGESIRANIISNEVLIFNNTGAKSKLDIAQFGPAFLNDTLGTRFYNNIFTSGKVLAGSQLFRSEDKVNIWNAPEDIFVDYANNDFRIKPGSIGDDSGMIISGVTDGYMGAAPEIGAYEIDPATGQASEIQAGFNPSNPLALINTVLTDTEYKSYVKNGTFQDGISNWTVANAVYSVNPINANSWLLETSFARNQDKSVSLGNQAKIIQTITGLKPNTTYLLAGWMKTASTAGNVALGVEDYGGSTVEQNVYQTAWTEKKVSFTTGANNTSATIYVENKLPSSSASTPVANITKLKSVTGVNTTTTPATISFDEAIPYINAQMSADKKVSFRLLSTTPGSTQLYRNDSTNKPFLIMKNQEGTTFTIPIAEGTYVASLASDPINATFIKLTSNNPQRNGYMKFDLSSVTGTISKADLKYGVNFANQAAFDIYSFPYNGWSSGTMTWANQNYVDTTEFAYADDIQAILPYDAAGASLDLRNIIVNARTQLYQAGNYMNQDIKNNFSHSTEQAHQALNSASATEAVYSSAYQTLHSHLEIFAARLGLEKDIQHAQTELNAAEESTEYYRYPIGSKSVLQSAIHAAIAALNSPSANKQDLNSAQATLFTKFNLFKKSINMPPLTSYTKADMSLLADSNNWSPVLTNSDNFYNINKRNTYKYLKNKFGDERFEFGLKYQYLSANDTPGVVLRKQDTGTTWTGTHYSLVLQRDIFQIQKWVNGNQTNLASYPNTLITDGSEVYNIQTGAANTPLGVRLYMFVNGQVAFDMIDKDSPILQDGYFGFQAQSGNNNDVMNIAAYSAIRCTP